MYQQKCLEYFMSYDFECKLKQDMFLFEIDIRKDACKM